MSNKNINASASSLKNSKLIQSIVDSAKSNRLIVVVGAGFSKGLTNGVAPSWKELIQNGLAYAASRGRMQTGQVQTWEAMLQSQDVDDFLSCAEIVGRKLGAPHHVLYERWLQEQFHTLTAENQSLLEALRLFSSQNIPICTLNYDALLESVTGLPSILVSETAKAASWIRRESQGVLHLHGLYSTPQSCVLGIRDYHGTLGDEVRDLFQRNMASFNQLLFIGCGDTFTDPNFSALINWMRENIKGGALIHTALTLEQDVDARNRDSAWAGFVEPLSYGKNHDCLASFLLDNFANISSKKTKPKKIIQSVESRSAIDEYKKFLLRDCGQMTIEGVSADMETGQRKFDLERLFVPLKVTECPPEFPAADPDKAEKLRSWLELNGHLKSFGEVLSKDKKIALLALPGGGKTLLLKRLAVAYADSERRSASCDFLPDMELIPVLIRCREWRDYVKQPIQTLLNKFNEITGQNNLIGFFDSLVPFLKKGQVLLLVDGLDEIHNDADRSIFVDNLESFLSEYKNIRLVITSREAGFSLVAPSISRFCKRWRIAPLEQDAIVLLCDYWHRLMSGDTPTSIAEGKEVAQALLKNESLRRLAENPLLLTMLLVVKHGAGGLPPDRVSLYGRAVEVLLDTWNIKGHEPLNHREAVPQLAYVAFHLMCQGKQTATEKELLSLLEEARENHPSIKRYAKDSPYQFLKRVELRSSLLLEAGHQIESGLTVPFYQFRHLTFQEYLAAVAVNEGHYKDYKQDDTILTPLNKYVLMEEWKEVIPMAAVLARKRAEPLLIALIQEAQNQLDANSSSIDIGFTAVGDKFSGAIGRLFQCFIEETEAGTETLTSALKIIAFSAKGCVSSDDWATLCRGPYGEELYAQAWIQFRNTNSHRLSWLMNTCAGFTVLQQPFNYWLECGNKRITELLQDSDEDKLGRGLLICMGFFWMHGDEKDAIAPLIPIHLVERQLFNPNPALFLPATWVWNIFYRRLSPDHIASQEILNVLLKNFLFLQGRLGVGTVAYALACQVGLDKNYWSPRFTEIEHLQINEYLESPEKYGDHDGEIIKVAVLFVAFHASILSNEDLLFRLKNVNVNRFSHLVNWIDRLNYMIVFLGGEPIKNPRKRVKG